MKTGRMDYTLMILTLILVSFGVLMVFSSSYYYAIDSMQNKTHFFYSELKWVALGVVAMLLASIIPYKIYRKLAMPLFILSIFLLIYVLFYGDVRNNARRWITIMGLGFMPAEVTKVACILFFSLALEKNRDRLNKLSVLSIYLGLIVLQVYLIMKQPNMSTAIIVAGIMGVMIFVSGLYWRYTVAIISMASLGGWLMVQNASYRMSRWTSFLDPFEYKTDESWQVIQSLYALGTGGVRGVGVGMSTQNKLYIPEPQNDFILATVGEELGLIGTVGLLMVFLLLLYRCVKIAMNAPDTFSLLIGTGVTSMLGIQTVMNYAVATSSMPATGVTLPLISYGGTSLIITLGAIGIMLNISKYSLKNQDGDNE